MAEYSSSSSAASDKVSSNFDLLTEILIRLPIISLMRFKSVSKSWFSLITSNSFSLLRNPNSTIVSGLFLHTNGTNSSPQLDFIPLIDSTETPTHDSHPLSTNLAFFLGLSGGIRIINSCHGLLLCRFLDTQQTSPYLEYIILNPTTKQFKILPKCHLSDLIGLTLAFDPSKSPHYKVIGVHYTGAGHNHHIMTFSSKSGSWNGSNVLFVKECDQQYEAGVYWNGAVNWFSIPQWGIVNSVYYNVDDERLGIIPLPPSQEGSGWDRLMFRHYGESRGHLHLVEINGETYRVDVYEMGRDYSGWFVKFSIDLYAFDIPWKPGFDVFDLPYDPQLYLFGVLSLVRMERDEESFLVLHLPGKILRYSFGDGTLKRICDVVIPPRSKNGDWSKNPLRYSWSLSFQYIESLFSV